MTNKIGMEWQNRARRVFPAGGFGNFDPSFIVSRGRGSRVWDVDGREYVDYLISSGPMILGHAHEEVMEAVQCQVGLGSTYFANNCPGIELAEEVRNAVACAEMVRFLASGTEADMYAVRLARAHTGRERIVKFEGGFHGMFPEAQISLAPTRTANFPQGIADSAGLTEGVRENVLVAPFNDLEFVRSLFAEHSDEIAAVMVEPFQRLLPPEPGFLEGLREECSRFGIVLIFDEIVTGFRFAYGGAQELYGVIPDICTLGKILGGGFPLAAVAGCTDIMNHFDRNVAANDEFLMHSGTLSGNPVAAVAGLKTLEILRRPGSYEGLREIGSKIVAILEDNLHDADFAWQIVGDPVLFDVVFSDSPMRNYRDCLTGDARRYGVFNAAMRQHGILKPVGKLYPSMAISDDDLEWTDRAAGETVSALNAMPTD